MSTPPVDYIELNMCNYDDNQVADLNEWGAWAYKEIERQKRKARCLFLIAEWFAVNEPATPVPEWCYLLWVNGEPYMDDEQMEWIEREETSI